MLSIAFKPSPASFSSLIDQQIADSGAHVSGSLHGYPPPTSTDRLPPVRIPNSICPLNQAALRTAIFNSATRGLNTSRFSTGLKFPSPTSWLRGSFHFT